MQPREIVRRAIEFGSPPRLPFWQGVLADVPNDVCDCWEMDRAKRGWFFDHAAEDDWGCGWAVPAAAKNMGQVVHHPLADWSKLDLNRYRVMVDAVHGHGWHFMLHSCGKVNAFIPYFIQMGADVLNLQQPRAYGIQEIGRQYAGKVCFLTTADIQATMPSGNLDAIRAEVRELVESWSTPRGGFIVFNYGFDEAIGTTAEATEAMFQEFKRSMYRWFAPTTGDVR